MTRLIACFALLLSLSACEYYSQTRVSAASAQPIAQPDVRDSLTGVGRQQ